MVYERWDVTGYDRNDAAVLFRGGINPLLSVVLASRGVCDRDKIKELICNEISEISDPMLMRDMDRAVDRVRRAISSGEHTAVYGDYDVDGITASAMMADYLRSKGLICDIYIPRRLEEGYGVNCAALDAIRAGGATLVITVDCGVTAAKEAEYAKKIGLDMVVTDHHECAGILPDAPVVDPKRSDCSSPAKSLAGVGVAFKLICALEGQEQTEEMLSRYSDLIAFGTIADVMPVIGENRILIKRGLESIRSGVRPGIAALCSAAGTDMGKMSVSGVGFILAPRINAAGRLGNTELAVRLLLAKTNDEAAEYAAALCELNKERQRIEAEILKSAEKMLDENPPNGLPIVLASKDWHQGVAGIVASRISEKFGLPAIMICLKDGVGRGSCRSCGGFNIFEALEACGDKLLSFGGHEMAAGLTIEEEKIDEFRCELGKYYENVPEREWVNELKVDFEVLKPAILTVENIDALSVLEPYGTGNSQPIMCMCGVNVENVVPLSDGRHTKLWLERNGDIFEAVFFGKSIAELSARIGMCADAAFIPQVNEFRGRRSVQLYMVDFKEHGA